MEPARAEGRDVSRFVCTDGRVYARTRDGWTLEARVIMERHLGRALLPGEHVFHRNGDPSDNRIENLRIIVRPRPNVWRDCECGCGMRIRSRGRDGRRRRFVIGHNWRGVSRRAT